MRRLPLSATFALVGLLAVQTGCKDITRQKGLDAYRDGRYEQARPYFEKVVAEDPTDWQSQYHLGLIALKQADAPTARTHLEVAYSLRGELKPVAPQAPQIVDALAEAIYQTGDYPTLFAFCDEAVQRYGTARDLLRKADYLVRVGDPDNALIAYRKAIKFAAAEDATPYVAIADFYESIGDRDEAIVALRQAYGIDPKNRQVAERLRGYGWVPGPTVELPADD
jgi:tetratricopeptide (TPR) repeat protein